MHPAVSPSCNAVSPSAIIIIIIILLLLLLLLLFSLQLQYPTKQCCPAS